MKLKLTAGVAFFLNTFLFGTYYAVAKGSLARIDPIVFTFFVMLTLIPVGLIITLWSYRQVTREIVKSGALMGSCLCLGLFTLSVALKYNSATSTAFFPSLNGFLAAFCAWLFLRHPIHKATWFAGLVSVTGALLLILNADIGGLRGALIAFIGGLFCTFYVFVADHEQKDKNAPWPLFGIQLLTMAAWACLIALLFGDWQAVKPAFPGDLWSILYISLGTTCLPTLITVWLQKHISPVTVSFIYILEPVLGAIFAHFYLGEMLSLDGYLGGGLIFAGALIHTWGMAEQSADRVDMRRKDSSSAKQPVEISWVGALIYPLSFCMLGAALLWRIGGMPPAAWMQTLNVVPRLSLMVQQGQWLYLSVLFGQSLCWLLAWGVLVGMLLLALVRTRRLLMTTEEAQPVVNTTIDTRLLRQMGIAPQTTSTLQRKGELPEVRRRRLERQRRLTNTVRKTRTRPLYKTERPGPIEDPGGSANRRSWGSLVDLGDAEGVFEQYDVIHDVSW